MITSTDLLPWRKKFIWDELDKLFKIKGDDYSGHDDPKNDTFKNLRLTELTLGIPTDIAIQVRRHDKFMRENVLLQKEWHKGSGPSVKEESLNTTFMDDINYLTYQLAIRAERFNNGSLPK